jgi:hypothetical protein
METLITLLIVIIIVGALLGGKSFGGTVRKGCGFLILLVVIIAAIGVFSYWRSESKMDSNNKEAVSSSDAPAYFIVKQDCQTYTKPNIKSDISGHLEVGEELFVENVNKFNYFYELSDENEKKSYVKKECLVLK